MTFNASNTIFDAEFLRFARNHLALPEGSERDAYRCDEIYNVTIRGSTARRHPDCPNGGETWNYRIAGPEFSFDVEAIWRDGDLFSAHRYLKMTGLKGEGAYTDAAIEDVKNNLLEWLKNV
jgi:hypothetical protein